jgi:hypothetical protein
MQTVKTSSPNLQKPANLNRRLLLVALVGVTVLALVATIVGLSWKDFSRRLSVVEMHLDSSPARPEGDTASKDWPTELDAMVARSAERIHEEWRTELDRVATELNSRLEEAIAVASTVNDQVRNTSGYPVVAATDEGATLDVRRFDDVDDVHSPSGGLADPLDFGSRIKSEYQILELSPEREAEVGPQLEFVLEAIWPAYVQHVQSGKPTADTLRAQYCAEVSAFLAQDEIARLGCNEGILTDP